jgi:protein TonB
MVLTDFSPGPGIRGLSGDLSNVQRWALGGAVVALHVLAGLAIWHTSNEPVVQAERPPLMVSLISEEVVPPVPEAPPTVKPPEPKPRPAVQPTPRREVPPVMASTRVAQAQDVVVPVVAHEPQPTQAVTAPAQAASAAVAEPPPPPQQPKTLPSSAVRFLIKPEPRYPAASQELGEAGTVSMRLLVDEQGRVKDVQLVKSSGYARLDRAAIAAEQASRLQPYIENGVPRSVWAPHSITFNLDER